MYPEVSAHIVTLSYMFRSSLFCLKSVFLGFYSRKKTVEVLERVNFMQIS